MSCPEPSWKSRSHLSRSWILNWELPVLSGHRLFLSQRTNPIRFSIYLKNVERAKQNHTAWPAPHLCTAFRRAYWYDSYRTGGVAYMRALFLWCNFFYFLLCLVRFLFLDTPQRNACV